MSSKQKDNLTCPAGYIKRASYKRASYKRKNSKKVIKSSRVPSTCIIDQGKPGHGPVLFKITKPGLLTDYGYSTKETVPKRHSSLKRAMSKEKPLEVLQHLNALRTLNKSRENIYNKMNSDMKYVQLEYKRMTKKTSKKRTSKK
jgi:hypothetical protein